MGKLVDRLKTQLATGLSRQSITTCSRWAEKVVRMGQPFPGPFSFKYHPWTREMHDSDAPVNVGQKSAQMGYTVTLLNRSLFTIDIKKNSVLYLLPTKTPDATDFSATRFDPLLESSEHLQNMFNDVKNVATKRAGSATLYIRGSNSRAGLKSIPVAVIMFDEYDEMTQNNIPLARERTSGQISSLEWMISTPTFPGFGINAEFKTTTQEHYYFECPLCKRQIELKHENLVITADDVSDPRINDSFIKCLECDGALTDPKESHEKLIERKISWFKTAKWVPTNGSDMLRRGFYINQLYSPSQAGIPRNLAEAYLRSQTNKAAEQEYHNSKMGDAHEVEGARVSDTNIINCTRNYRKIHSANDQTVIRTMGVDVGSYLHIEIDEWHLDSLGNDISNHAKSKLIWEGKIPTDSGFHQLDDFMRKFQIHYCVIDANPERASAKAFANRFWGYVSLCFYANSMSSKSLAIKSVDDGDFQISVDRTVWLDTSLGRFSNETIELPVDLSAEYKTHIKNIARIYQEDQYGNPVGRYINSGDDHFAHARNYSEIALPLAASIQENRDIRTLL